MDNLKKNPSGRYFFILFCKNMLKKITRIFLSKYVFFSKMNLAYFWNSYHHVDKFILYKFILLFFEFDAKWNSSCDLCYTTVKLAKTSVLTSKTTSFQRYDWTLNCHPSHFFDKLITFLGRISDRNRLSTWVMCHISAQSDLRFTLSTYQ